MLLNKRIPVRYIISKVKQDFFYVLIVSLTVLIITEQYKDFLPEMPLAIPTFIGTAISILLSFKLNQSYDRWWEARKVWGAIVNDSRSFAIQLQTLVAKGNDSMIRKMVLRQIAWCYSLGQGLRGLDSVENLDRYLSDKELDVLKSHTNKPLALLTLHGKDIQTLREQGSLDVLSHLQLDDTLVRLCDAQGKAERIKNTIFPVTYRIFLHSIIYLFVVTLSISLKDVAGFYEIPLLLLISTAFFLLEKSATHMQDPFENRPTDTPVTAIAKTIELNLKQIIQEKELPDMTPTEKFYLL